MLNPALSSSAARKKFYDILRLVGEGGDNYTVSIYKKAKVRIIREDLAQVLEEIIGKATWAEAHKILARNPRLTSETKETLKKLLKPRLG